MKEAPARFVCYFRLGLEWLARSGAGHGDGAHRAKLERSVRPVFHEGYPIANFVQHQV